MNALENLKVKIFADGASLNAIKEHCKNPWVKGFTSNPTLMRKAGVVDYKSFAHDALELIENKPISFEVFADSFFEMESQAREIASWSGNIYVKIPVMNTRGQDSYELIKRLSKDGIKVNVTAVMDEYQIYNTLFVLDGGTPAYISIFAGRIADTGVDPVPIVQQAVGRNRNVEVIWASPRELLNIFQANSINCDIITVSDDILKKLPLVQKNLHAYSLETVEMFFQDAQKAGYTL